MAAAAGVSQTAVSRIWRAFGLKPHLIETWKLSTDPQFIDKVRDIVGLYRDPPSGALVLCVDEKSQIQALDRTAPCLPVLPTTPARRTHDYVRNGTTSLFAAFETGSGSVIAQPYRQHRHQEFIRFLKLIDDAVPKDLDLHLVLDNYATHKTPEVHKWLLRHPRFHLHFTPTSASWMNLVERWFAELTRRKLSRSARRSVTQLEADLRKWTNEWKTNGTRTRSRSSGPRAPTRSSTPSPPTASELTRDTSTSSTSAAASRSLRQPRANWDARRAEPRGHLAALPSQAAINPRCWRGIGGPPRHCRRGGVWSKVRPLILWMAHPAGQMPGGEP